MERPFPHTLALVYSLPDGADQVEVNNHCYNLTHERT